MKSKFLTKVFVVGLLLFLTTMQVFSQANLPSYTIGTSTMTFDKNSVNAFDRISMCPYSKPLDYVGTALEVVCLVTPASLFATKPTEYLRWAVQYLEVAMFAYAAKEVCKATVYRPRPYMYFEGAPESKIESGDWDDSFCSGHTTMSFAAVTFTTFMLCKYFPESKWKIPVICASYGAAAVTAVVRICSGNHFATDVLAGALIGSAIGFLVPFINSFWDTPKINENTEVSMSPVGVVFNIKL